VVCREQSRADAEFCVQVILLFGGYFTDHCLILDSNTADSRGCRAAYRFEPSGWLTGFRYMALPA